GAVSVAIERIELVEHLLDRLVPLLAPEILDDVAELAFERTAAGGLQGAREGQLVGIEIPSRHRRGPPVRPVADVFRFPVPALEVGKQLRRDLLDLSSD